MPTAVTHILLPILLVALFRDFYIRKRDKRKFPLHYVLLAGLGGILPDIDFVLVWIYGFLGFSTDGIHRTITHSFIFPLVFLILFMALIKIKYPQLGRHKLTLSKISLMLFIGIVIHLSLDASLSGPLSIFYPFLDIGIGSNIFYLLPTSLQGLFFATLDGILLVLWLIYLEVKHKISDFI